MSALTRIALRFGLLEQREHFVDMQTMRQDVLLIPKGFRVEGEIHTDLPVIVEGEVRGTINIRGEGDLTVMRDARISEGLISANRIDLFGEAKDVAIDVDRLTIGAEGRVDGKSEVRYDRIIKDEEAPINGHFQKRKSARDGFAHIVRIFVETRLNKD